jgi:hypothetical protein
MKTQLKTLFLSVMASAGAGLGSQAAPMVSVGDALDIFIRATGQVQYDSNIALDKTGDLDDTVFRLTPGIEFNVGRGRGDVDASLILQQEIVRYTDLDRFDTEKFSALGQASYGGANFSTSFSGSFREVQSNTNLAAVESNLIERDEIEITANAEIDWGEKFSTSGGIYFRDTEYQNFTAFLSDRTSWAIPANVYYTLTSAIDLSAGYRFRSVDVEDSFDSDDHFFNVGLRGDLTEKLDGFFKIGYQVREFDEGQDDDSSETVSVDGNLSYQATEKIRLTGVFSRDFDSSGVGNSVERTSSTLRATYSFNRAFSASSNIGYTYVDYSRQNDREDDLIAFGITGSYRPNEFLVFQAGYQYSNNDSSINQSSYTKHLLSLSGSFRY